MAVEGPGRTALNHFRRHCSEQNGNVAIVYGDLRDESAGASRRLVAKKRLKQRGIELYDDCFELGLRYGEVRLVEAAREDADASGSSHVILRATGALDAKTELALGDEADMLAMPSPGHVSPAAGIALFQQEAKPGVEALVSKGVSVAGTICPSTIPVICSPGFARLAMQAKPPQPLSQ